MSLSDITSEVIFADRVFLHPSRSLHAFDLRPKIVVRQSWVHIWIQSISTVQREFSSFITMCIQINSGNNRSGRAPGADDDGSGTVNLIEVFRALVASGFKPTTPVEFHFNAGEEGGLLGSQGIATSYKNAAKSVKAYVQFDMTA